MRLDIGLQGRDRALQDFTLSTANAPRTSKSATKPIVTPKSATKSPATNSATAAAATHRATSITAGMRQSALVRVCVRQRDRSY